MIDFICDTCSAVKEPEDVWIVGLAAEAVGAVSSRREVNIQSTWTREAALHLLAVHFCSIQCKDKYMARMFGREQVGEVVVERAAPAEVMVVREVPETTKVITKARKVHRRKRAS
jgi:hypothetical protein